MELRDFVARHLAEPMGWGRFDWGYRRPEITHTPGGGGIAPRATDMRRFAWLLLREGRWGARQVVPAPYVRQCGRPSHYNPHFPESLTFENNSDGRLAGVPRERVLEERLRRTLRHCGAFARPGCLEARWARRSIRPRPTRPRARRLEGIGDARRGVGCCDPHARSGLCCPLTDTRVPNPDGCTATVHVFPPIRAVWKVRASRHARPGYGPPLRPTHLLQGPPVLPRSRCCRWRWESR